MHVWNSLKIEDLEPRTFTKAFAHSKKLTFGKLWTHKILAYLLYAKPKQFQTRVSTRKTIFIPRNSIYPACDASKFYFTLPKERDTYTTVLPDGNLNWFPPRSKLCQRQSAKVFGNIFFRLIYTYFIHIRYAHP